MPGHDIAIRWEDGRPGLAGIRRIEGVSVFGYPTSLRIGGLVLIVQGDNEVTMVFRVKSIEGPKAVRLAGGKRKSNGYIIRAVPASIRIPRRKTNSPVRGFHAIGAFRYVDASKWKAINLSGDWSSSNAYVEAINEVVHGISFFPHVQGIPGLERNHPEAKLVDDYVNSADAMTRFGHNYIRQAGLYVDLFDLTHWRLIEAKASPSRESIRMAVGQLLDYKRFYDRSPSLAVLVPDKPSISCRQYVRHCRVNLIWKTASGRFSYQAWAENAT